MRLLIQRVKQAKVKVENKVVAKISKGILIFQGVENDDDESDISWLVNKVLNLRIFNDSNKVMNLSVKNIEGQILVVSQFTLMASTKKGNRPSYINAAPQKIAFPLYENFVQILKNKSKLNVLTGEFGADMKVSLINDGPVTIIIDSKNRDF